MGYTCVACDTAPGSEHLLPEVESGGPRPGPKGADVGTAWVRVLIRHLLAV